MITELHIRISLDAGMVGDLYKCTSCFLTFYSIDRSLLPFKIFSNPYIKDNYNTSIILLNLTIK